MDEHLVIKDYNNENLYINNHVHLTIFKNLARDLYQLCCCFSYLMNITIVLMQYKNLWFPKFSVTHNSLKILFNVRQFVNIMKLINGLNNIFKKHFFYFITDLDIILDGSN